MDSQKEIILVCYLTLVRIGHLLFPVIPVIADKLFKQLGIEYFPIDELDIVKCYKEKDIVIKERNFFIEKLDLDELIMKYKQNSLRFS